MVDKFVKHAGILWTFIDSESRLYGKFKALTYYQYNVIPRYLQLGPQKISANCSAPSGDFLVMTGDYQFGKRKDRVF